MSTVIIDQDDPSVLVRTSDDAAVAVEFEVAVRCGAIRKRLSDRIRDVNQDGSLTFNNVTRHVLLQVFDYCRTEWPGDFHSPPVRNPERSEEEYQMLLRRHKNGCYPKNLIGYGGSGISQAKFHYKTQHQHSNALSTKTGFPFSKSNLVNDNNHVVRFPPIRLYASPGYERFLKESEPSVLCELASAAYYLEVKPLIDLTCRSIADMIKGKSPEEIRTTFHIQNDFTPVEEEQVRKSVLEQTLMLPPSLLEKDIEITSNVNHHSPNSSVNEMVTFPSGNAMRDKLRNKLLLRKQISSVPPKINVTLEGRIYHEDPKEISDSSKLAAQPDFQEVSGIELSLTCLATSHSSTDLIQKQSSNHENIRRTSSLPPSFLPEHSSADNHQFIKFAASTNNKSSFHRKIGIPDVILEQKRKEIAAEVEKRRIELLKRENKEKCVSSQKYSKLLIDSLKIEPDIISTDTMKQFSDGLMLKNVKERLAQQKQLEETHIVEKRVEEIIISQKKRKQIAKKKRRKKNNQRKKPEESPQNDFKKLSITENSNEYKSQSETKVKDLNELSSDVLPTNDENHLKSPKGFTLLSSKTSTQFDSNFALRSNPENNNIHENSSNVLISHHIPFSSTEYCHSDRKEEFYREINGLVTSDTPIKKSEKSTILSPSCRQYSVRLEQIMKKSSDLSCITPTPSRSISPSEVPRISRDRIQPELPANEFLVSNMPLNRNSIVSREDEDQDSDYSSSISDYLTQNVSDKSTLTHQTRQLRHLNCPNSALPSNKIPFQRDQSVGSDSSLPFEVFNALQSSKTHIRLLQRQIQRNEQRRIEDKTKFEGQLLLLQKRIEFLENTDK